MKTSKSNNIENILNTDIKENLEIKADNLIIASDLHGNYSSLNSLYTKAKQTNSAVVINGDFVNDYAFTQYASDLGYKTQSEIFLNYAVDNLDKKDLQTLFFAQNYNKFQSLEPFLEEIPKQYQQEAKKSLENMLQYAQSDIFSQKFENLTNNFKKEKEGEVIENKIKLNALYHIFMEEEAKTLADFINKYDTQTIFNLGNHENYLFVEKVKQYLEDPDKIINLSTHHGYLKVNQNNGESISIAGMTNCIQPMPYLQEVLLSQEEYNFLTNHMSVDEIKKETILIGDENQDKLNSLESLIKKDSDYLRITKNQEQPLDIFLSHGQIGKVLTNNNNGYDVPYFGVSAYLSNLAQYTVEGHIHSKYDGINSFGNKMVRAAGEDAVIFSKDEQGNLTKEWFKINENFDGNHNNPIAYDKEDLKQKVENLLEEFQSQDKLSNM